MVLIGTRDNIVGTNWFYLQKESEVEPLKNFGLRTTFWTAATEGTTSTATTTRATTTTATITVLGHSTPSITRNGLDHAN